MHALSLSCVMPFSIRVNICLAVRVVLVKVASASNKIRLAAKICIAALLKERGFFVQDYNDQIKFFQKNSNQYYYTTTAGLPDSGG